MGGVHKDVGKHLGVLESCGDGGAFVGLMAGVGNAAPDHGGQAAFAQLVERQSVLRTVIGQHEGAPYQHVLEKVDATLTCDD